METTGTTIPITGGRSGLGRGLAQRFRTGGDTAAVAGRRLKPLPKSSAEHEGMASGVLDVAEPAAIRRALETVIAHVPALHVPITNAGIRPAEVPTDPTHLADAEATSYRRQRRNLADALQFRPRRHVDTKGATL